LISNEIPFLTIAEAAELIKTKQLSPVELTKACLDRIALVDNKVFAWVTVLSDEALKKAQIAETKIMKGEYLGPLHGIPYGAKDIIYTANIRTGAGSDVQPDFIPQTDATVIRKLDDAGAILLGKTATTEYAFLWGKQKTRNPWNLAHTPGGSSSGSGAAVSASTAMFSLGTQTVGSLLRPSAYNALTCLKATYGRVSRYGVIPASWSLDHVGALTKSVEDTAIINEAINGYDPHDPSSLNENVPKYCAALNNTVKGMVVGIPDSFFIAEDKCINEAIDRAILVLKDFGIKFKSVKMPDLLNEAFAAADIVMRAEAAAYHKEKFAQVPEKFGSYIRGEIQLGMATTAVDYIQAQRVRTVFRSEMRKLFNEVDVILTPTTITLPPKGYFTGSPAFNGPFTNSGLPAMTIPVGFDSATNLPIGMQLAGPELGEDRLISLGNQYQRSTNWHQQRPAI
jgi:aspartyl-tRNA(Asn)/glutamyl-tRNA(Gln) amidotransferase subunit A